MFQVTFCPQTILVILFGAFSLDVQSMSIVFLQRSNFVSSLSRRFSVTQIRSEPFHYSRIPIRLDSFGLMFPTDQVGSEVPDNGVER